MVDQYCEQHSMEPDALLKEVERSVYLHTANPHQSSDAYEGAFLQLVSAMLQPTVIVELGVYAAYSTICLARGMAPGGTLYAVEVDDEREPLIRKHLQMAQQVDKVHLCIGKALEVIPTLPDDIDLAFIDADKGSYPDYYELLLPKMRRGGVMLFDNMLWYGKVLEPAKTGLRADREAAVLAALNDTIQADDRVDNILLPIRDGIMLCRRRR